MYIYLFCGVRATSFFFLFRKQILSNTSKTAIIITEVHGCLADFFFFFFFFVRMFFRFCCVCKTVDQTYYYQFNCTQLVCAVCTVVRRHSFSHVNFTSIQIDSSTRCLNSLVCPIQSLHVLLSLLSKYVCIQVHVMLYALNVCVFLYGCWL